MSSCWTSNQVRPVACLSGLVELVSVYGLPVVIKKGIVVHYLWKLHLLKCFFFRPGTWAAVKENSDFADKKKIHLSKCMRNGS